jgi:hypothetical protein
MPLNGNDVQVSGDGTVSQIFKLVVRALLGHDVVSNSEYFQAKVWPDV